MIKCKKLVLLGCTAMALLMVGAKTSVADALSDAERATIAKQHDATIGQANKVAREKTLSSAPVNIKGGNVSALKKKFQPAGANATGSKPVSKASHSMVAQRNYLDAAAAHKPVPKSYTPQDYEALKKQRQDSEKQLIASEKEYRAGK